MIWPFKKKTYKIQSFTYYIPAPPKRESGYREKQFDKVFYHFINKGYEIISLNTQSDMSPNSGGFWIICLVKAKNKKAEALDLDQYGPFNNPSELETTPEVFKDLYPLEET